MQTVETNQHWLLVEYAYEKQSKGGTTEQAIQTMEKNDIKCKIITAIHAASERSHGMSDEFSRI